MSSPEQKLRVVPASAVRHVQRLTPVNRTEALTALQWNLVARTDDDLSLTFVVDLSRQRVSSIAGVQVIEGSDRVASARYGEYMIDLAEPLAGRTVANSEQ